MNAYLWVRYEARRGLCCSTQAHGDALIGDLSKLIQLEPQNARPLYLRAELLFEYREYKNALADCTRALELDPHHRLARKLGLRVLTRLGRTYEGLKVYRSSGSDTGRSDFADGMRVHHLAGQCIAKAREHLYKGEHLTAVGVLSEAIGRYPEHAGLLEKRAEAYTLNGQPKKACAD